MSSTPEADGVRMTSLHKAMTKALEKIGKSASFEAIAKAFPDLLPAEGDSRDYVKDLYQQYLANVTASTETEFGLILEENGVREALNSLDKAAKDVPRADGMQPLPRRVRGPGDVADAVYSKSVPLKRHERDRLVKAAAEAEAEAVALEDEIRTLRQRLRDGTRDSASTTDLERAAMACDEGLSPDVMSAVESYLRSTLAQ